MCCGYLSMTWLPFLCNSDLKTGNRGAPPVFFFFFFCINEIEIQKSVSKRDKDWNLQSVIWQILKCWVLPREEPVASINYRAQKQHVSLGSGQKQPGPQGVFLALGPLRWKDPNFGEESNTERKWKLDLHSCPLCRYSINCKRERNKYYQKPCCKTGSRVFFAHFVLLPTVLRNHKTQKKTVKFQCSNSVTIWDR